jgi:hypothetical protein
VLLFFLFCFAGLVLQFPGIALVAITVAITCPFERVLKPKWFCQCIFAGYYFNSTGNTTGNYGNALLFMPQAIMATHYCCPWTTNHHRPLKSFPLVIIGELL